MKTLPTIGLSAGLAFGLCAAAAVQPAPPSGDVAGSPLTWRVGPTARSFRMFAFFAQQVRRLASSAAKVPPPSPEQKRQE